MNETVGKRLKRLREEIGLSQHKVASITGLDHSTISAYERDERLPSVFNLCILADFYKVTMDYIMGRETKRMLILDKYKETDYKKIIRFIQSLEESQ